MSAALDLPAACRGDVTLTMSHRTAARRVRDGEPVGDLGEALGALYLHDLVRDRPDGRPELSPDGLRWLAAHDEIVEKTRPTPRPTPDLPPGWREDGDALIHRDVDDPVVAALLRCDSDQMLVRAIRQTDAMLALMRWEQGRRTLARMVEAREGQR